MSRFAQRFPQRSLPALAAGVSSFMLLAGIFLATMLQHYRAIDLDYLSYALVRITAVSLLVAGAAFLAGRHLRSMAIAAFFGAVAGILGGVAFVNAAYSS